MKWKMILISALVAIMGVFLYKEYRIEKTVTEPEGVKIETPVKNDEPIEETIAVDQPVQGEIGLLVGQQAPNIQLTTLDGKPFQLSDYRGKKVILNFWATWCPPCKAEMPDMQKFYEEHRNEGVEIVAVNLTSAEKNQEDIQTFIEEYDIGFTIPLDQTGAVAQQFEVYSIPTSYLIDKKGTIGQLVTGPMSYDWMVNEVKKLQ